MQRKSFLQIASKVAHRYLQSARSVPLGVNPGDWNRVISDLATKIQQKVQQKSPLAGTGEIGEWLLAQGFYDKLIKPLDSEDRVGVFVEVKSRKMPDPIWSMWRSPDRAIVRGGNATRYLNRWKEMKYDITIYMPSDLTYKMLMDEYMGEGKHSLKWGLRRILDHELTHLTQKIRAKSIPSGLLQHDPEKYYNSVDEVEARIQEAVREAEHDAERFKHLAWDTRSLVRKVLDENHVWFRVKNILNAKNKRRFLEAIYTTVSKIEIPDDGL